MSLSAAKRAWIAVAVLAAVAISVAGAIYLHYKGRAAEGSAGRSELPVSRASPEQAEHTRDLIGELPGDAIAVAYIDVAALRRLQGAPLASLLGLRGDSHGREDRDYQQFVRETGFDYTRDLDRAAIAFWPGTAGEKSPNDRRVFVAADGRFDEKRIVAYALKTGKPLRTGARTVYKVPGAPPVALEFLSPGRLVLTSAPRPEELLLGSRTVIDPRLRGRIERLSGAPLFIVARSDKLPDSFYANFHNSPQAEVLARSVRGLALAVEPQGGVLKVAVEAETASSKDALAIATLLEISRLGASLALSDSKTRAQLTPDQSAFLEAVVRQSKMSHQDRWVRLSVDVAPSLWGGAASSAPANLPP